MMDGSMQQKYDWVFGRGVLAILCFFPAELPASEPEVYEPTMNDEFNLFMDLYRNDKYAGARSFGRSGDYNTRLLRLHNGVHTNGALGADASVLATASITVSRCCSKVRSLRSMGTII